MLTGLRKHTRGVVAGVFMVLLVAAFALWGINDVFSSRPSDGVASGGGVHVSAAEFQRAYDSAVSEVRQNNGGRSPTPAEAVQNGFDLQVLERLVTQGVLDRLADKMGFGASDQMVAKQITDVPAFRSQITNKFDKATYQSILAQNQLTPELYEADLRSGLKRQQLAQSLTGAYAPKALTDFIFQFETEKRYVTIAAAPPQLAGAIPEPTEAELAAFYEQNKSRFATPEYRKITLAIGEPVAFESKVVVAEEDIRKQYEFQKARLGSNEKRSFTQISAPSEAAAAEAAKRLVAGQDAAAVAAALQLQAIPFNAVAKAQVPDAALADAVFALQEGQTTSVIKGPLAWAVAKVTKIEGGAAPTYESMRDQLRAGLAKDQAEGAVNDAIQRFEEERSGGKTLEQAAQETGLLVVVHDRVTAQGTDSSGAPIQTISDDPTFVQQIFATGASEATDFTPLKTGGYILARVDDIIPAGFRPLADVKPMLVMGWKAQKVSEAIKKIHDAMIAEVKAGKPFAEAARAHKMPIVLTDGAFTRQTIMQSPAGSMAQQVFAAKQGEVVSGADARGGAILVALVTKIEKTDPAGDKQLYDQARAAAGQMVENDLLVSLQTAALQDAKVKYNETLRHQTIGYVVDQAAEGAQ